MQFGKEIIHPITAAININTYLEVSTTYIYMYFIARSYVRIGTIITRRLILTRTYIRTHATYMLLTLQLTTIICVCCVHETLGNFRTYVLA